MRSTTEVFVKSIFRILLFLIVIVFSELMKAITPIKMTKRIIDDIIILIMVDKTFFKNDFIVQFLI